MSKQQQRQARQNLLLMYFSEDKYQERRVGDKWFVKMWNRGTKRWQVAEYSLESFKRYKTYNSERSSVRSVGQDKIEKYSTFKDGLQKKLAELGL